jgi:hypothetical protein
MQFVSALVVEFGLSLEDAWYATPQEFWSLHDWKLGKNGTSNSTPPMSSEQMAELEKELANVIA